MKTALFWDFDGTLTHRAGFLWSNCLYAVLDMLGYDIPLGRLKSHFSSKSDEAIKIVFSWHTPEIAYPYETGQRWWDRLFAEIERLYRHYGVSKDHAKIANAYLRLEMINAANYTLYANAAAVLAECKRIGFHNYILSNNYPELHEIVGAMGIADSFDDIVVSADVGYEKPRIELFEHAKKLAGNPDMCFMIGDNPVADIQGGKNAGMRTILVHQEIDCGADHICADLSEIPALLTRT